MRSLGAKISKDGGKWRVMVGENLQSGFDTFGDTPYEAMTAMRDLIFRGAGERRPLPAGEKLKQRVSLVEQKLGLNGKATPEVIETDIVLPEADIDGLHFNKTEVHAVFEQDEDGACHSRDILFLSARDTDEGTGRDLLSKYLDSEAVREAFRRALRRDVKVFLPEKNMGVKKYNGVPCWYWLRPRYSAPHFCGVNFNGFANLNAASAVGGCAPAFRVTGKKGS
jgi:hypothetical protein